MTTEPRVFITPDALRAIVARARRDDPNETCGLLVGRGDRILEAVETPNTAADPTRQYEISPVEYFAQIKRCRRINEQSGEDFAVLGAYHSHPRSAPAPSPTDVRQAFHDFVYLIVGPVPGAGGLEARAYRLGQGGFEPLELLIAGE